MVTHKKKVKAKPKKAAAKPKKVKAAAARKPAKKAKTPLRKPGGHIKHGQAFQHVKYNSDVQWPPPVGKANCYYYLVYAGDTPDAHHGPPGTDPPPRQNIVNNGGGTFTIV